MATFPTLKTGAVLQYPARRSSLFSTHVLRFLDGGEQRYRNSGPPLKRWSVSLRMLDEKEVHDVQEFFRTVQGQAGTFSFIDPWDGATYASCSLQSDELSAEFLELGNCSTELVIQENRN
jgi:hypothetical protein